jgi:hypothetical protein
MPCDPPNIRVQGRVTNTEIPIAWDSASAGGGSAIAGYKISWESLNDMSSGGSVDISAGVLNALITGLSSDQEYYVLVQARNNDPPSGNLSPGNVTLLTKTAKPNFPTDPYNIALESASRSNVVLNWTEGSANGGNPINRYEINWTPPDNGGTLSVSGDLTTAFIPDLEPGSRYTFTMQSFTSNASASPGYAKFSAATVATNGLNDPTDFGIGGAPTSSNLGLSWTRATLLANMTTISGYRILWQPPDAGGISNVTASATSALITGLSPSTRYVFNIITFGTDDSDNIDVTSPGNFYVAGSTIADGGLRSPTDLDFGTVTSSNVPLTWTAAIALDPIDYVTFYTIRAYDVSESAYIQDQSTSLGTSRANPPPTFYTFSNLSANTEYRFSLSAHSFLSYQAESVSPTDVTTTTARLNGPLDPVILKDETVVGTNSIVLAWEPSDTAGGTAINRYTVTIDPPNTQGQSSFLINVAGTIPPFYTLPITSLAAGTVYAFTVVARNASSISSPGENTEILETLNQGGPAVPTNLRADEAIPATPTSITAKWDSAFRNGGPKIASYTLYVKGGEVDDNYKVLAPTTSYTVADLTPNTPYSVSIAATNSNELSSPISAEIMLVTDLEDGPAQPAFIDRAATPPPNDNSNISVAWNTASTDGGTDISGYQVTWSPVPIK